MTVAHNTTAMAEPGFVPGTVHLIDLEGTMNARHADGVKKDIVLVPAPSRDPNDPLNWSRVRKLTLLTCLCVYVFSFPHDVGDGFANWRPQRYILAIGIAGSMIYSVLVPISEATNLTLGDLNAGTGYMFLMYGWGCLVWQAVAQQYGKRPVYLLSLLATMVSAHVAIRTLMLGERTLTVSCVRQSCVGHHTRRRTVSGSQIRSCKAFSGRPLNRCVNSPSPML